MGLSLISLFTFVFLSFLLFFFHLASSRQSFCHDNEHSALLQFKESLAIDKSASYDASAYPKTTHWNLEEDSSDCCSWEGVKCNEDTGYVIELDLSSSCLYGSINSTSTLFNLVHLQWLSIADNDFDGSKIPSAINNLSKLSHLNLSFSVFSGQIPSEMLELSKLESLDLSKNGLLQLQQPGLESLAEKLTNLKVLDLSGVNISSSIPHGLTNLSALEFLFLESCELEGTIPSSLGNLNNLIRLDLSQNNFWGIIPFSFGNLNNLIRLNLFRNNFWGTIPSSFGSLNNLIYLDLSQNNFWGIIPSSLGSLNNLIHLDLSDNNFWGTIPSSLSNLNNLIYLDLSRNNFWGTGPSYQALSSLSNLTHLIYLDLSYNNFSSPSSSLSWIGKITKLAYLDLSRINIGEIPFWFLNLTHLTYLDITNNQLTGPLPFWLMNLNRLSTLDLSYNQLSGHIPSQISNLTQLSLLDLSSNQLQSPLPSSIFELNNLERLYLSSNNLSGTIEWEMFLRLKSLRRLSLSSNRLSLLTNFTVNASSHQFDSLRLESCNLRDFPDFLRNQDQLYTLDLSSNNISGHIPEWLFNLSKNSLQNLNLSHNLLTGFDQRPVVLPWANLLYLDLSFNKLPGPLPFSPTSAIEIYLVSNNKLSGEIPFSICKLNSLRALDLSNNNFSGKVPQCLGNFSRILLMLNLQNNKFSGSIPQTFMNGSNMRMIDLSNNMLRGKIPRSLANCTMLEFLDLGNNKISDTFPSWIGILPNLEVLNLQSNKLYGAIEEPKSDFEFPKLRIIDLSQNRFTGKLPSKYFECWNAMKVINASKLAYMMKEGPSFINYGYSLTMVNKGIKIEYVKISNMLVYICLSNNRFEGEIPASVSILKGLRYLNLSNNNLIGGIPSSLGSLTVLESLDLSSNNLLGEIPPQLVKLTPLAFFNVSCNHLTGPIPQGAQFDTFSNMSYEGNPGLCGRPLSRKCRDSDLPPNEDDDDEGSESPFAFGWKEVAIGYASGMIFGVVLGYIFLTRKHELFVKIFGMPLKRIERKRGRRRN